MRPQGQRTSDFEVTSSGFALRIADVVVPKLSKVGQSGEVVKKVSRRKTQSTGVVLAIVPKAYAGLHAKRAILLEAYKLYLRNRY